MLKTAGGASGGGSGTVTQVSTGTGLTGGPITGTGTISLISPVAANLGGTGLTSFTSNAVVYASSTNTLTTGSTLTFNGTGMGLGTSPSTATKLIVGGSLTGATTGYGVLVQPTVQPDVTSAVHLARSQMSTAANGGTPYTISNSYNYYATQGTYNADSTVTAQYGFFVASALTGATTNTGFYGQLASGTGRYNLYMAGTADNYLAGTLGIGTTSLGGGYGLRVTKTFSADNGSGVFSSAFGSSSTPTGLFSFRSSVSTATNSGTPYTIAAVYSYHATQGTFDADSTVTTQSGFLVSSALTGATNNYGFLGSIASGTGRYNLYMAGTADNYIAGNLGIKTASPGSALDVKGTLRLSGATSGYVGFSPAAAAGSTTYTLPSADGTNGQALTTNGSGTLSFASIPNSGLANSTATLGNTTITLGGTTTSVGNLTLAGANISATSTANATFATSSLPLIPEGYITILINGTNKKIPYYGV